MPCINSPTAFKLELLAFHFKASYKEVFFAGDIGGQIGLFVGASALTFFEFIDCFFMCIHARFFEIFRPRETQL